MVNVVVMRNVDRESCQQQVKTLKVGTRVSSDLHLVLFIDFSYGFPRITHFCKNIILFLITFLSTINIYLRKE